MPLIPLAHARDARGRFAPGHSGNPRGRPPGIANPKRRVPDLRARPLSPEALSDLLDRKPDMLRPLAVQLLPPPLAPIDPAERLGINVSAVGTAADAWRVLSAVWAGILRDQISPAEGKRLARRVRSRQRILRRLARLQRRMEGHADPRSNPLHPSRGERAAMADEHRQSDDASG